MPRNASGVYSLPNGSIVSNGETVLPSQHNTPLQDIVTDLNTARPVSYGGTGQTSAHATRDAFDIHATFDTKIEAEAATMNALENVLMINGRVSAGDGGDAIYDRVGSEPSHEGKLQTVDNAWWEIRPVNGVLRPEQFGDCTGDAYTAVNNCCQAARLIANTQNYALGGAGSTQYSKITVFFSAGSYLIGTKISLNSARVNLVGHMATIGATGTSSEDLTDYLIEFTGLATNQQISNLTFECTSVGALKWNATNSSSARVNIEECRFVTDRFGSESGIGVDYVNQSSSLTFNRCLFNRVKHPVYNRNCDFVTFDQCWFGNVANTTYSDDTAMVISENGFMRVNDCIFAAGPAWFSGKTDADSNAIAQYRRVAYFQIGSIAAPAVDDNGRISISNTRIGYESGEGSLVNYYVRNAGSNSGAADRGGVELFNIMTAPQEDKVSSASGVNVTPLVRLYHAPHFLIFRDIHSDNGNLGLVAAQGTTLATLRGNYETPAPYNEALADQQSPNGSNVFIAEGISCPAIHYALPGGSADSDKLEANRWSELFGHFNYVFASDAPGGADTGTTIYVNTFFDNFGTHPDLAQSFYVSGDAYIDNSPGSEQVAAPIRGWIDVQYDENADAVWARFSNGVDYSQNNTTAVDARGFWNVTGTPAETVTLAQAATATLGFRLQHIGGSEAIRCRRLRIIPASALFDRSRPGINAAYQY